MAGEVPSSTERLAARLIGGWIPPATVIGRVTKLIRGKSDLSSTVTECSIAGRHIELVCRDEGSTDLFKGYFGRQEAFPIEGETSDGYKIHADTSFVAETGMSAVEEGASSFARLNAYHWFVEGPEVAAVWITRLDLDRRVDFGVGNVEIRSGSRRSVGHVHFRAPEYHYWLIRSDEEPIAWWLVVDARKGVRPETPLLLRDITTIAFSIGSQLNVSTMTGLTESLAATAAISVDSVALNLRSFRPIPPVPVDARPFPAPALFNKITADVKRESFPRLQQAMRRYLQSGAAVDTDTRYMELVTGIEMLAHAVLDEKGESAWAVRPSEKWYEWLQLNEENLKAAGATPEIYEVLNRGVVVSKQLLLRKAATILGLEVPEKLTAEFDYFERDFPKFGMAKLEDRSIDRAMGRLADLRLLLTAMISRMCHYDGPIGDGDVPWWPASSAASPKWEVLESNEEAKTSVVWPTFSKPQLPNTPLVEEMARFAGSLVSFTKGNVIARLQATPEMESNGPLLEFKIYAARFPDKQVELFSVTFRGEKMKVHGWEDREVVISTSHQLAAFLKKVSRSKRVRVQIQRLMILSDDMLRGAR